ncbi:ribonuclease [Chloropicon primus]|uniref:Ribonuclease n=1 Tax=Chloropicon primus TaxID=1764295 RepID=A0A5B8MY01_9CHLO|nr:ribonuclease [Chloropicon primus]UPR03733.1 ribonuclease [Chloropicon primus]|eukprot:QDZ24525.1 ribonuclease [Chloropicon primus]
MRRAWHVKGFSIRDAYRFCRLVNKILDGEEEQRSVEEWRQSEYAQSIETLLTYVRGSYAATSKRRSTDFSIGKVSQDAQRILGLVGQNRTLDGAVRVLVAIGAWKPHTLVSLEMLGRDSFDDDVVGLAERYMNSPPPDPDRKARRDLTHLRTVTIDDISTTEIDDGLSVEALGEDSGRKRIWIHIADPTRWLSMEDCIFKEAKRRATSIYVPTGVIPMVPYNIATQTFSLVEGVPNCAFSLGVELDMETGEIEDYVVAPSTVLVDERLTYVKTDQMLSKSSEEADPDLFYLARAAKARWTYRKANGSETFASYSPNIKVDLASGDGADVRIERNDAQQQTVEYTQSGQSIVSEMMILAGEVGAKWGKDNGVPLPYRIHYKPVIPDAGEVNAIEDKFARTANMAKSFTRAVLDCRQPKPHASLGLPYYTQLSSPIRRFNDVLVHLQMKSVLRGEGALFTADEFAEMAETAYFVERDMKEVAQQCDEYWTATYFSQHMDRVWDATFLSWKDVAEGMGFVQIDEVGVKQVLRINNPIVPGEKLRVRAVAASPRLDGNSIFLFEQVL